LVNLGTFPLVFAEEGSVSVGEELGDGNALVEASFGGLEKGELSSHVDALVFGRFALFF
jgi:hypothetical protein